MSTRITTEAPDMASAKRAVEALLDIGFTDITVDIRGYIRNGRYAEDHDWATFELNYDLPVLALGRSWATIRDPDDSRKELRVSPVASAYGADGRYIVEGYLEGGQLETPHARLRQIRKDGLNFSWRHIRR